MKNLYLAIVLAPLVGSIIAGLFGRWVGRRGAHWATILGVAVSFVLSAVVFERIVLAGAEPFNGPVYTWMTSGGVAFQVGFLVDHLTATMILVVSFVSLMVHIYSIGYMEEDPGYQRFFSYIALFTFSMLMLVMSNNFLQLFFGWEAVGLVSYLLIGFWYQKESAVYANLKAFLVNRVGDLGFLLGIAAVLAYFHSLDYAEVFRQAPSLAGQTLEVLPGVAWSVMSLICLLLFVGAMGKSAQVPLHVWLPDSMEGPTPISALIHAATMVTAGIFMVARMSPLFELSETALSVVLVIGAITAFFMGLLAIVQNDIKRVVAYSTLSQLGYMAVALGASAYAAAIFHLVTHAFFKALLFLAAGSVIIAMHHEQDIRKMGGLRRSLPLTHWTFLIGTLALCGIPPFAGFFSKDGIIDAVQEAHLAGAGFAYALVLSGVFITALYSFRLYFLVFHGSARTTPHGHHAPHEPGWVVTLPLVLLAIPSLVAGAALVGPMLFGDLFGSAIRVLPSHAVLEHLGEHYHGVASYMRHGVQAWPFWLAVLGVASAWYLYVRHPHLPAVVKARVRLLYTILDRKYGFDDFNDLFVAGGARAAGRALWRGGDVALIDGVLVNGTARSVAWVAALLRSLQSGYLYHYAFSMIIGLLLLLSWFVYA
jgi:NADH-quinone oxidoreductase subunit L